MKVKHLIGIAACITLLAVCSPTAFAQSPSECTVTAKSGSNLLIISCPDGSRTVDAGGRADLYRVGDRVDIYGLPANQPTARPGETPLMGR
jgi:hypothetical protein